MRRSLLLFALVVLAIGSYVALTPPADATYPVEVQIAYCTAASDAYAAQFYADCMSQPGADHLACDTWVQVARQKDYLDCIAGRGRHQW